MLKNLSSEEEMTLLLLGNSQINSMTSGIKWQKMGSSSRMTKATVDNYMPMYFK